MSAKGWIGVDLDGTLAHYESGDFGKPIGAPVAAMVKRVQHWLAEGHEVRVFTARVSHDGSQVRSYEAALSHVLIHEWCIRHIGRSLKITCTKDHEMIELWDDRCVQVKQNTGEPVGQSTRGL